MADHGEVTIRIAVDTSEIDAAIARLEALKRLSHIVEDQTRAAVEHSLNHADGAPVGENR